MNLNIEIPVLYKGVENSVLSLDETRACINLLDDGIVSLLAKRLLLVGDAARFKKNAHAVADPGRVEQVIHRVRERAILEHSCPDFMESVYRNLINLSIAHELEKHEKLNK